MDMYDLITEAGAAVRKHTEAYHTDFGYDCAAWALQKDTLFPVHWMWFVRDHGTQLVTVLPNTGDWKGLAKAVVENFGDGIKAVYMIGAHGKNDYTFVKEDNYMDVIYGKENA